jgi:hypothetical protein
LVAAGGLVVVLAILLVFLMVLRSNGDARKMSSGFGYDGQHGPPGQPRAPVSQPSRQTWGGESDYAAPAGAQMSGGQGSWGAQPGGGQWQDPNAPAAGGWNGAAAQPPSWGGAPAQQGGQQPGWGAPAQPSWGGAPAQQGGQQPGWGGASAQPPQQPGWGGAQQPPSWGGAPAQQGGQQPGWGAPAATAQTGQEWGAPVGQPNYGGGGYGAQPGGQRMGVLVVRQGKEPGRTFEMRKDRTTIGRSRDSDIFLEDLAVSRLHTTIGRDTSGRYIVHDENSANGTFVNGQRISEHVLEEGDEVQVGQTVMQFVRR